MRQFCVVDANENCHIISTNKVDAERSRDKAMFAILNTDPALHFDSTVHTSFPGLVAREISTADLPSDRYFRNAWKDDGVTIDIDMVKAQPIHMKWIRKARDAKLKELDIDFMRAVEASDTVEQKRIADLKQVLRDIPQNFDLARVTTPEDLKALWPAELPSRTP